MREPQQTAAITHESPLGSTRLVVHPQPSPLELHAIREVFAGTLLPASGMRAPGAWARCAIVEAVNRGTGCR